MLRRIKVGGNCKNWLFVKSKCERMVEWVCDVYV